MRVLTAEYSIVEWVRRAVYTQLFRANTLRRCTSPGTTENRLMPLRPRPLGDVLAIANRNVAGEIARGTTRRLL